ncbi:hypothetical protein [Hyunsoonleella aestuarii]|uniref:Beta-carotene 15,15'-monooxygenase n=1 Tax=Hyunsoonleella aestuarii TaxID=912802 RepID=A0ABP8ECY6_9FLAO|nr:hypothetical protein [Hyunsoonleella aestuarii]
MDELDLLKKDWNKQQNQDKTLSSKDIYPMLHKKSSSIVKTLFYISIAELILWILVNTIPYLYSEEYRNKLDVIYTNDYLFTIVTVFSYAVILLFIYLLFKSQRSISVTDNARKLMESILRTRKIIKYYVLYNLVVAGLSLLIGFYFAFTKDPKAHEVFASLNDNQLILVYGLITVVTIVFILIIWLFYKLIYGLLLKRLNRNYAELKKLEV